MNDIKDKVSDGPIKDQKDKPAPTPHTVAKAVAKKTSSTLPEVASLHEKAVQAIAEGKVPKAPRKPRKKAAAPKQSKALTKDIKVLPLVWDEANRIVDDKTNWYVQIEIVDDETVIVR